MSSFRPYLPNFFYQTGFFLNRFGAKPVIGTGLNKKTGSQTGLRKKLKAKSQCPHRKDVPSFFPVKNTFEMTSNASFKVKPLPLRKMPKTGTTFKLKDLRQSASIFDTESNVL
jgi:hypothetical protein